MIQILNANAGDAVVADNGFLQDKKSVPNAGKK